MSPEKTVSPGKNEIVTWCLRELDQHMDDLNNLLTKPQIRHLQGRQIHPQSHGKIERHHYLFYHALLDNDTQADMYFGRKEIILVRRKKAKYQMSEFI